MFGLINGMFELVNDAFGLLNTVQCLVWQTMRQQHLIEKRLGELTDEQEPVPGPSTAPTPSTSG
jgi:hypothetical protein